jgi:3-hydroxyisobutyrate dehydrogenase-like beta-hydroxyacid dehydrogenase
MAQNEGVKRTGVIGLGAMGVQMARHMVGKGHEVHGYDISPEAAGRAKSHGVSICASPAEVGRNAEVVIVMVANDSQIEEVIAKSGLLESLAPGSVICIASSCARNLGHGQDRGRQGIGFLDTAGGARQAADGTVTPMWGATNDRSPARSRCSQPSAGKSCMSAISAPGRSRNRSTTCCCGPAWWRTSNR